MSEAAEEDFCKNANHTWVGTGRPCRSCAKPTPTVEQTLYWAAAALAGKDARIAEAVKKYHDEVHNGRLRCDALVKLAVKDTERMLDEARVELSALKRGPDDEAVREAMETLDNLTTNHPVPIIAASVAKVLAGACRKAWAGWRCFHCGEFFSDKQEAADHFAIEGIPPMCVDPITKDEKARMTVVRKLESEVAKLRKENEELDYMAGSLEAMKHELSRYFGQCGGAPVKTASQAFLVYESVIGRAEAAEARAEKAERDLAEVKQDRDEWKDSTKWANERFKLAEAEVERLRAAHDQLREDVHDWMQAHPCCDYHVDNFSESCGSPDDNFKALSPKPCAESIGDRARAKGIRPNPDAVDQLTGKRIAPEPCTECIDGVVRTSGEHGMSDEPCQKCQPPKPDEGKR